MQDRSAPGQGHQERPAETSVLLRTRRICLVTQGLEGAEARRPQTPLLGLSEPVEGHAQMGAVGQQAGQTPLRGSSVNQ